MSDQRKKRSELRQGLHQYLMQMYVSYTDSMSQEAAKKLVMEVMEEEYEYFSVGPIGGETVKDALTAKITELTDKMETITDFDTKLYYAEKIDTLESAIHVMDFKIS